MNMYVKQPAISVYIRSGINSTKSHERFVYECAVRLRRDVFRSG